LRDALSAREDSSASISAICAVQSAFSLSFVDAALIAIQKSRSIPSGCLATTPLVAHEAGQPRRTVRVVSRGSCCACPRIVPLPFVEQFPTTIGAVHNVVSQPFTRKNKRGAL
jgi:hypothetical protein